MSALILFPLLDRANQPFDGRDAEHDDDGASQACDLGIRHIRREERLDSDAGFAVTSRDTNE